MQLALYCHIIVRLLSYVFRCTCLENASASSGVARVSNHGGHRVQKKYLVYAYKEVRNEIIMVHNESINNMGVHVTN